MAAAVPEKKTKEQKEREKQAARAGSQRRGSDAKEIPRTEYKSSPESVDAVIKEINGLVEDMDYLPGRTYLGREYHMATNPLLDVAYMTSMHVAQESAIRIASYRNAMGMYDMDRSQMDELVVVKMDLVTPDLMRAYRAWYDVANNKRHIAMIKAYRNAIFILQAATFLRTGHHYTEQNMSGYNAFMKAEGLDIPVPAELFYTAIHPTPVSVLFQKLTTISPDEKKELPGTVLTRMKVVPAGWAWIGITRIALSHMTALTFGPLFTEAYGEEIARLDAALKDAVADPVLYADVFGGGRLKPDTVLTLNGVIQAQTLCAIARAFVMAFVPKSTIAGSPSFKKYAETSLGTHAVWHAALKTDKRSVIPNVRNLCLAKKVGSNTANADEINEYNSQKERQARKAAEEEKE